MARTSSVNCRSCRNPYQTPHSLNASPLLTEKTFFCHWKVLRRIPFPKSAAKIGLPHKAGRKKAHKHKLFALVNIQMALGQTAGCPRVNRAKKFMCSPRNTGNINFSLWLTGGLSQGCPDFQKVYVFKVYVPFSCPNKAAESSENSEIADGRNAKMQKMRLIVLTITQSHDWL